MHTYMFILILSYIMTVLLQLTILRGLWSLKSHYSFKCRGDQSASSYYNVLLRNLRVPLRAYIVKVTYLSSQECITITTFKCLNNFLGLQDIFTTFFTLYCFETLFCIQFHIYNHLIQRHRFYHLYVYFQLSIR